MSQRQQLERIFEIDRSIRAGEFPNASRLAEILEVSKRVIYNDRVFMIDRLGAPIAYDQEKGGSGGMARRTRHNPTQLACGVRIQASNGSSVSGC